MEISFKVKTEHFEKFTLQLFLCFIFPSVHVYLLITFLLLFLIFTVPFAAVTGKIPPYWD